MLKPLRIGSVIINHPVILAPMSGITDWPFRKIVKKFGAGAVVSEMVSSEALIRNKNAKTMQRINSLEFPKIVQLFGRNSKSMSEAAKINADLGADILDINMGCPAKKIVNEFAGAALMKNEPLAIEIINAVIKATSLPVTIKIRLGWDENNKNAAEFASKAQDCGVQLITVHGRTRSQFYSGKADWEAIAKVKEKVSIPILCNGDIDTEEKAIEALIKSKADGIMIGRGALGKPWFLEQVICFLQNGIKKKSPELSNQLSFLSEHMTDMMKHYGKERFVFLARKHICWYSKGMLKSCEFREKINAASTSEEVFSLINNFYGK